ncbi:hypothetical protein BJF78_26145 [Pseudonocardia sp. CNS-139]|nr:hypothetical protein BJF78_26145 [Pseudonocardia sp. CNS-139]
MTVSNPGGHPPLDPALVDIAVAFFEAVSQGDMDAVRDMYSPEVLVWHNFDRKWQSREENLQLLSWVSKNWVNFRFEDVRRQAIAGGFLQQHTMRGEDTDGVPFDSPSILLVWVDERMLITRVQEYFESGQVPLPTGLPEDEVA